MKTRLIVLFITIAISILQILPTRTANGETQDYYHRQLEWSRDGKIVAFIARPKKACSGGKWCRDVIATASVNSKGVISQNAKIHQFHLNGDWYFLRSLTLTTDGKKIACIGGEPSDVSPNAPNNIYLYKLENSDKSSTKLIKGEYPQDIRWSPDGKHIAYTEGLYGGLYIINPDTAHTDKIENGAESLTWSPDGSKIAYTMPRGETKKIRILNSANLSEDNKTIYGSGKGYSLDRGIDWSPDGKWIAFVSDFQIYLVDATGINPQRFRLTNNDDRVTEEHPRWSPDGKKIAYTDLGKIHIWNLETGKDEILKFNLR